MRMRVETESFTAEYINRLVEVCTCTLESVYFGEIARLVVPACAWRSRAPSCPTQQTKFISLSSSSSLVNILVSFKNNSSFHYI